MHKAVKIKLVRAEGPQHSCGRPYEFTEDPWVEAHRRLVVWSASAPGAPGESDLGVDKTDFWVTYDDGNEYAGTFGLTYDDQDLPAHMRGHLEHVLAHEDAYKSYIDIDEVRQFLADYEIGAQA